MLVLLQVLLLNNINLFNYLNPYIYILFVLIYPLKKEGGFFLILSFVLGLTIDFFSNSGGINAAATLFIAYIRIPVLNKILNKSDFDLQSFKLKNLSISKMLSYIFVMTFIHHFILYSLEYFSFSNFSKIITTTILSTIFTVLILVLSIVLFSRK
ncbi:rod shape-determining protein MreD [Urechidicola sp. KH5]